MSELTEAEVQKMNAGRVMRAESDILLPLLQTKQSLAVGKLIQAYRAGDRDAVFSCAAELSTIQDMKSTIGQKIKEAEALERKAFDESR